MSFTASGRVIALMYFLSCPKNLMKNESKMCPVRNYITGGLRNGITGIALPWTDNHTVQA